MEKERFIKAYRERLDALSALSIQAGSRADYVQGGGGNTSVKFDDTLMAIKASGFCLSDIRADAAYAVLDYRAIRAFFEAHSPEDFLDVESAGAAEVKASIRQIEGLPELRPSVEAGFHSLLDTFVLHSHSVYANLAACSAECGAIMREAFRGAGYAVVPYVDPGTRLTFAVQEALMQAGKRPPVLLMQNHGLIAHHDDMEACLAIHADANERIAAVFHMAGDAFPQVALKQQADGSFVSDTPFLTEQLKSGAYSEEALLRQPLYPDQLVFLNGTFTFGMEPGEGKCALDTNTGLVHYRMDKKAALVVEETLTAVTFIISTIQRAGYTLSVMGEEAKSFIANWESEQYRKSLAAKG